MADRKLRCVVQSPNGHIEIRSAKVNGKEFSFDVSLDNTTINDDCTVQEDDTINMKVTGTTMGHSAMI